MQQVFATSGSQGTQAEESVSFHSTRSVVQTAHSSFLTPDRLNKRKRIDTFCDPAAKQQQIDGGLVPSKARFNSLKPEVCSLAASDGGMGGLADIDRFLSVMGCEWNDNAESQLDLVLSRTMMAKAVATTTDQDCLVKFLKLGGLAILYKWWEEAQRVEHFVKTKISKDGEKAVQDLLLTLLVAFERLPVDLSTLKACPSESAVGLFGNDKQPEVQKRVTKLAEAWKIKVGSEINQQVGGSLQMDTPLFSHQHMAGATAQQEMVVYYPDHSTSMGRDSRGPGNFASAASVCPFSGEHYKVQVAGPATSAGSVLPDVPVMVASLTRSMSDNVETGFSKVSRLLGTSSPSSEDGIANATDVTTVVTDQLSLYQMSVGRHTIVPGYSKILSSNGVKSCSMEAAVSDLVDVSKDMPVCSSKLNATPPQLGVALPFCSSVNMQGSDICSGLSMSSLQMLPCVTDCEVRTSLLNRMSSELRREGNLLLANVAASPSSMADTSSSHSVSNKNEGVRAVPEIPLESSLPPLPGTRCGMVLRRAFGNVQKGDHLDQFSSSVSSPSETSAYADICLSTSHPLAIVSGTHDHAHIAGTGAGKKYGASMMSNEIQQVSDDMVGSLPLFPAEIAGEREDYVNANCQDFAAPEFLAALRSARHTDGVFSSSNGINARSSWRAVADSHGGSLSGYSKGNASFFDDSPSGTNMKVTIPRQKTQWGSERVASSESDIERPIFDLNEIVECEDRVLVIQGGAVTLPAPVGAVPVISDRDVQSTPPTAPIAVVVAAKGFFALPSGTPFPKGELGWKGSAPTSAFRRAQPRHKSHKRGPDVEDQSSHVKMAVDFDLNVAASDSGFVDHGSEFISSMVAAPIINQSIFARNAMPERPWDLNQVGGGGGSKGRRDIDLNSGPVVPHDYNEASDNKYARIEQTFVFDTTNSVASGSGTSYPMSVAPDKITAFAMNNFDLSSSVGMGVDEVFQYSFLLQNRLGMACPSLPSLPAASSQGIPYGFSSSMNSFSAPYRATMQHSGSVMAPSILNVDQSYSSSQSMPFPYLMGNGADAIQTPGDEGLWRWSDLDLNAGPDCGDDANVNDDVLPTLLANKRMMAVRHQPLEMAAALKQSAQDGCLSLPLGLQ